MKSSMRIPVAISTLLIAGLACNVSVNAPSDQPNVVFTAAAQTVAAVQASLEPQGSPTSTPVQQPTSTLPVPTFAPLPTLTSVPPATQECDKAAFVADVTIPDGTVMSQGQAFQKTWRLKNIGTCTWTTAYKVVFFSGPAMADHAQQPLIANVEPNQTVDITVNMTAPAANGNYTEYWKLRNASGVNFSQFYVQIAVQGGVGETTVALNNIPSESGQVRSDGTVLLPTNTGDTPGNETAEAFFSFDISSIPSTATITQVLVNFSSFDVLGNPFSLGDGCVRAYHHDYGTLTFADFFGGDPLGASAKWCSMSELLSIGANDSIAYAMQNNVSTIQSRFQLRVQFRQPTTNFNNTADTLRFGVVTLTVTYH